MKENELYVTEQGVFIGIRSISGRSVFVKVLSVRDGKVNVQNKEMVIVDPKNSVVRDPLYGVDTQLTKATAEQVEQFQRLENVKTAVAEDKRTTGAVHDLTGTNTSGAKRI